MTVRILIGDCRETMKGLPDASVDSVVCDPPYHLTSIVKRFGKPNSAPVKVDRFRDDNGNDKGASPYSRASKGFMGQTWDGGDVAFDPETWAEVLRVLKPGGHLIAFSGTRTYHRMVCAIEDAGFEIRDQLAWVYGSGFPKSHDISKQIDKAAGAEREVVGPGQWAHVKSGGSAGVNTNYALGNGKPGYDETAPATAAAREWQGWGTALKPSWEPICLARKPISEKNIAANVLKWGTGALNIDATRIGTDGGTKAGERARKENGNVARWEEGNKGARNTIDTIDAGRWPANLCHDGSDEVLAGFPAEAGGGFGVRGQRTVGEGWAARDGDVNSWRGTGETVGFGDSGSAARFFYCAKATTDERNGGCYDIEPSQTTFAAGTGLSKNGDGSARNMSPSMGNSHPTVKPVSLMQWLVRMVTPKGGTVLDPFMGSGSTGIAADAEQFDFIGCELSAEYAQIAERRIRDSAGMFADVKVAA
jgi:site-specific DNA-methyltransferase (adenine-specific)